MTNQHKPLDEKEARLARPEAGPGGFEAIGTDYRVELQGRLQAIFRSPAGQSLLQAALAQGVALPSSCRNGTCRACLCKLVAGEIAYRIEWPGLSREEKTEGWILPCVAEARSDLRLFLPG